MNAGNTNWVAMFRHFGLAGVDFQSHCRRRGNPVPSRGRAIVLFIHIGGSGQVLINWHNFVTGGRSAQRSWTSATASHLRGLQGCVVRHHRWAAPLRDKVADYIAGAQCPATGALWNVWPGSPLFGREREQTRFLHPARAADPEHRPVGTWRQPTCSRGSVTMRGPTRENYFANSSTRGGIWAVGGIGEELARCAEWCSERRAIESPATIALTTANPPSETTPIISNLIHSGMLP